MTQPATGSTARVRLTAEREGPRYYGHLWVFDSNVVEVLGTPSMRVDGEIYPGNAVNRPLYVVNTGRDRLYPAHVVELQVEHLRLRRLPIERLALDLAQREPFEPFLDAIWAPVAGSRAEGSVQRDFVRVERQRGQPARWLSACWCSRSVRHRACSRGTWSPTPCSSACREA